jgi:hypothetical protein
MALVETHVETPTKTHVETPTEALVESCIKTLVEVLIGTNPFKIRAIVSIIIQFLTDMPKKLFSIALCKKNPQGSLCVNGIVNESMLMWALQNNVPTYKLCKLFVGRGDCLLFQRAVEAKCPFMPHICEIASERGFIDILKYLNSIGQPWTYCVGNGAARNGHLDCLKFVHETGYKLKTGNMIHAIMGGNLNCVKYLHRNNIMYKNAYIDAAKLGHLSCLKYFYEKDRFKLEYSIGDACIVSDKLECLRYICEITLDRCITIYRKLNGPINTNVLKRKFINNHIKNRFYNTMEHFCYVAIKHDRVQCLQFIHNSGHTLTTDMCNTAVKFGKIKCLKYMQHLITSNMSRVAVQYGKVKCLRYIHESGILLANNLSTIAVERGYAICYNYIREVIELGHEWATDSSDSSDDVEVGVGEEEDNVSDYTDDDVPTTPVVTPDTVPSHYKYSTYYNYYNNTNHDSWYT